MSICTIFSHVSDLSLLPDQLEKIYGPDSVSLEGEKENWTQLTLVKRKVLRKVELVIKPERRGTGLEPMLTKLKHVVGAIPAQNDTIRQKLMVQIDHFNSALEINAVNRIAGGEDVIFSISKQLEGLIFYEGNKILDKKGILVLDFKGRVHVADLEIHSEGEVPEFEDREVPTDAQERKAATEAWMEEMKIPYNAQLPVLRSEEETSLRSVEEIVERALALNLVALKGEGLPMETVRRIVKDQQLKPFFSPKEVDFVRNPEPEEAARINFAWRYESLYVLLWALGYAEELDYPSHICDVQAVVRLIYDAGGKEGLLKNAHLRSKKEVLDATDKIYRLHWAVVDARLRQEAPPVELEGGVVFERHYALNWLTRYLDADWDDVSADT